MKYKIKTMDGKILYETTAYGLRDCCQQAVASRATLQDADLRGADLRGADLRDAYLRGADLRGAYLQGATLRGADLRDADLRDAYLRDADLQGADLRDADLRDAYLRGAYLQDADLRDAYLRGVTLRDVDLRGVKGVNKYQTTPMYMLLDQSNPVRAYKVVNSENTGIYNPGLIYKIDEPTSVDKWNDNEMERCGAGINLASLDWCLREWREGYKILLCEFAKEDVVCIPIGSDGKFRVKACTPIKELDLAEYGVQLTKHKEPDDGK